MIFLKKSMEMWYFLQMFWKDGLSKKIALNMIFLVIWYFFFRRKMKDDLFQKMHGEIWYFRHICKNVTNMILPFYKKNQRWSSPKKIHLKVIDMLDHILERVPAMLCTFMETFKCIFIYCFPVKKNIRKLNI